MRFPLLDLTEGFTRAALRPEERLLLAVVDSAYWDLRSPDPIRRKTATQYFLAEDQRHTFSFVSICQHFSWSPTSIRTQLGTWLTAAASLVAEDRDLHHVEDVRHAVGSVGR